MTDFHKTKLHFHTKFTVCTLQNSCWGVYSEVWCEASKFPKPRFKFRTETTKLQVSTTAICNIVTFSYFMLHFVIIVFIFHCFTDILTGIKTHKVSEVSCFLEGRSQGCLCGKILGQPINPDFPTCANTWGMMWLFYVLFWFFFSKIMCAITPPMELCWQIACCVKELADVSLCYFQMKGYSLLKIMFIKHKIIFCVLKKNK